MKTQTQLIEVLESLVDSSSLSDVLHALATMCSEKAEHIRVNWQDENTARVWDRANRTLAAAAIRVGV